MSPPRKASSDVAPKASAYLVGKLRDMDAVLVTATPRVLAQSDDEAVHDLRVAIRRMRTLLKMSRRVFGRWHADAAREAFAEVMRATGELRDEEVLEEVLAGAARGPAYEAWLRRRQARKDKLRRAMIARIERGGLDRARVLLKALLVFPVEPGRDAELARFARRTVARARRKVERRRDVDVTDGAKLHELRIAYKELRYSIEILADALPIDARAQLEPATVLQKRLGEIHDVDVAIEVLRVARGLPVSARDEALATLQRLRDKRAGKYLRELDPLGALPEGRSKRFDRPEQARGSGDETVAELSPDEPAADEAPTVHIEKLDLRRAPAK